MGIVLTEEPHIWLTSDWHFGHDREFIWKARGFASVEDMNEHIIAVHNAVVKPDDDVYVLGDLMLGDSEKGIECIKRLNGKLHIVWGNHDTDSRKAKYSALPSVVESGHVIVLKYKKHHFYMSHYPTLTGNLEKESLTQMTLNLFGHTHQKTNFHMDMPFMYHVGVDSHKCFPVNLDNIIEEMHEKVKECKEFLDEKVNEEISEFSLGQEEGDKAHLEPRRDFVNEKCDKCVWYCTSCSGPIRFGEPRCPTGKSYKRDPPDGGYYG